MAVTPRITSSLMRTAESMAGTGGAGAVRVGCRPVGRKGGDVGVRESEWAARACCANSLRGAGDPGLADQAAAADRLEARARAGFARQHAVVMAVGVDPRVEAEGARAADGMVAHNPLALP